MKIKAQVAMILNLDKCLGCHTCSIPCKHLWTNRPGAEYMWFNNVETKPGIGYPKRWEDQQLHRGGWQVRNRRLGLRAGGRARKLMSIFHNSDLPPIDDYYEPWTYNYENLRSSDQKEDQPTARAHSLLSREPMKVAWGPNWEDDLAGVNTTGREDVNFANLDHQLYLRFQKVFMFYLPRLCEHCLNPGCVASCPSGALHKRDEDGIVLVDQERCRGWRFCVSGCPYKKVYFNWKLGRAEKCLFCYPRVEAGLSTLCSESCVGRIRSMGVFLYDADSIADAASTPLDRNVYPAHLQLLLNPHDPDIAAKAVADGVPEQFITSARQSPVYKLAVEWKIAFPLHPEFRTLPMVWYIPPLSPLVQADQDLRTMQQVVDAMRIPVTYLANLLTGGDEEPIRIALGRLMALRVYMRSLRLESTADTQVLDQVGLTEPTALEMYRLLAIGKHSERFVVPTVRRESVEDLHECKGDCGFPAEDYEQF